jgi:hypothetical protein
MDPIVYLFMLQECDDCPFVQVAVLQEKLRFLERSQGTHSTSQSSSEDLAATSDHVKIDANTEIHESHPCSIIEEVRGPETARDDDPVLQQSFSRGYQSFQKDSEFGSLQGTMDTSASLRKQHRPFIVYPKLEFKVVIFCVHHLLNDQWAFSFCMSLCFVSVWHRV